MSAVLAEAEDLAVFGTENGVVIRKAGLPFFSGMFVAALVLLCLALGFAAVGVAGLVVWGAIAGEGDVALWVAVLLPAMFLAGGAVCFCGAGHFLTIACPGQKHIERHGDRYECRSAICRLTYRRRWLFAPLRVVAEVYEASRRDWAFRLSLAGADGCRFRLTIPSVVSSSKSSAGRVARSLAGPIAAKLGAGIAGLD